MVTKNDSAKEILVESTMTEIGEIFGKLSSLQKLAFAVSCCERCLPNYPPFQKESGLGNIAPLADSLKAMWDFFAGKGLSGAEVENMVDAIAIPEDEDHDIFVVPHSDLSFQMTDLAQSTCIVFFQSLSMLEKVIIGKAVLTSDVLELRDYVMEYVMAYQISGEIEIAWRKKQANKTGQWKFEFTPEYKKMREEANVTALVDPRYIKELTKQLETLHLIQKIDLHNEEDVERLRLASTFDGASSHGFRLDE